ELGLPNGHRTLSLTLQPSLASVVFGSTALDFGSVVVGDSSAVVVAVSNPTGTADLTLSGSASPIALSLPDPIAPAGSADLTFRFRPTLADGGSRSGTFSLKHKTAAATTTFEWTALVLGGRGDADGDGSFDVADLVLSLDGTVDPGLIPAAELPRHDVYPFPAGDGALDIRDLTVAIQAILRGQWPDATPLPVAPGSGAPGKGIEIALVQTADSLWLSAPIPLRGVQLVLVSADPLPVARPAKRGALLSEYHDPASGEQRILLLAGPGAAFEAGHLPIAALPQGPMPPPLSDPVRLDAGVAVDRFGGKHPIVFRREDLLPELPEPELDGFGIYPNPVPLGSPVHLDLPPVDLAAFEVFDTLGRRLFSQPERVRQLPADLFRTPGTYFIRIQSGALSLTRSVVVTR
ncbi:MAG: T9SS type A sorting domain-containing protein, partial [Bacteroidetes bacterium]|nr:T9SS type A sorting domain-containing protein [Bacteroidota bacterium]